MNPSLDPLTRLRNTYARLDRDYELARIMVKAGQTALPAFGSSLTVNLAVKHSASVPQIWWQAEPLPQGCELALGLAAGPASPVGATYPLLVKNLFERFETETVAQRLSLVNRELLKHPIDDGVVTSAMTLVCDAEAGELVIARAGLPNAVVVPAKGAARVLTTFGPMLGVLDADYEEAHTEWTVGTKVILAVTDVTETDRVLGLAEWYRELSGQTLADAILADLAPEPGMDSAVMVLERMA